MALNRIWWVTSDPWSLVAAGVTLLLTLFAQFVVVKMLLLPWLGATSPHLLGFLGLTLLSIAAHCKSQFTDPGAVPVRDPKPLRSRLFADYMRSNGRLQEEPPAAASGATADELGLPSDADSSADLGPTEGLRKRRSQQQQQQQFRQESELEEEEEHKHETALGGLDAPRSLRQTPLTCNRCQSLRPLTAHHCRICGRCVLLQDHHCPYLNNCVGIYNQKYFFQFLLYTLLSAVYTFALLVARFVSCSARPTRSCRSIGTVETVCFIIVFIEALIFGVFVSVMLFEQLCAVFWPEEPEWDSEEAAAAAAAESLPPEEEVAFYAQLDRQREEELTGVGKLGRLRLVFGGRPSLSWLLPTSGVHPEVQERYRKLAEENLIWVRARSWSPTAHSVRRGREPVNESIGLID